MTLAGALLSGPVFLGFSLVGGFLVARE